MKKAYRGFPKIIPPEDKFSEADYRIFLNLKNNKDFIHWRKANEDKLPEITLKLLSRSNAIEGMENQLDYYRGQYDCYQRLFMNLDQSESILETIKNNEQEA